MRIPRERKPAETGKLLAPMLFAGIFGFATAAPLIAQAQAQAQSHENSGRTYINPLDIDYKYNFEQLNEGISYRSSADPVIVPHGNEYYLFATIAGGYWRSPDLARWEFIRPDRWPMEDVVAPAAISVDGTIYLYQSTFVPRPIFSTREPATGKLEFFNRWMPVLPDQPNDWQGPWDPDFFHDPDTDRWYLYWGSSNVYPLWGIELDFQKRLAWKGKPKELLRLYPHQHGWERFGQDHADTRMPFIEGASMIKHGGKYYLQYGAPGTEYNVYANGVAVGDSPLGPFTYAPYNPMSYKPGGYATGAGHGGTFRDHHGNYWNTGTTWIGVNWHFERRLVMFPAGFDRDGQMFSHTRFGDFPQRLPAGRWSRPEDLFTGWMLLSYRKPARASSTHGEFAAGRVTDEDPRTFWVAADRDNQWIAVDLGGEKEVRAVQVNYADYQSGLFESDEKVYTQFRLAHSRDGADWEPVAAVTGKRDRPNAYIELAEPLRTRHLRYEHVYAGAAHLAISDIRVFGSDGGAPPATPGKLAARRHDDERNATITWAPVRDAVGYNVLWGIAPGKLYQAYQRFADQGTELEIRALNVGQPYYFAIEAFDESGVSRPSAPVPAKKSPKR